MVSEDTRLNGSPKRYCLVGVDSPIEFLAIEEVLQDLLHLWNASRPADQYYLVDFMLLEFAVLEDLFDGFKSLLEQIDIQFLEFGSAQRL